MPLRVMQLLVPADTSETLDELLEGREALGRWDDADGARVIVQLLIPAEESEPIMDRFEEQYAGTKGFHVVLLPVEAVLPRPDPEAAEQNAENPAYNGNNQNDENNAERISREELYAEVTENLGVTRVFVALSVLSALVAAVGLLRDDVAVIIGAMVIAPLLVPNVAMSLATTLGDFKLLRRALVMNVVGVVAAFLFAVIVGWLFAVDAAVESIASRTKVNVGDIVLALAAGSAGTLAYTRGLPGAVIGVMVAVALVPPLVVAGMLLGAGHFDGALGALLLTASNVICINLAGVGTFLIQGVRPRSWWEAERAKRATWQAMGAWAVLLALLALVLWLNR